jgi:hypothetical protein
MHSGVVVVEQAPTTACQIAMRFSRISPTEILQTFAAGFQG